MNSLRAGLFGSRNNPGTIQIALGGLGRADMHRRLGGNHMRCLPVRVGIDCDCAQAQTLTGPHKAQGNLAPVGDQNG